VPLSINLGTLNSWNPLGHTRPETGLLYWRHWTALLKTLDCFTEDTGLLCWRHRTALLKTLDCFTEDTGLLYWRYWTAILKTPDCFTEDNGLLYWSHWTALLKTMDCFTEDTGLLYWRHWTALLKTMDCFTEDNGLLYWRHWTALLKALDCFTEDTELRLHRRYALLRWDAMKFSNWVENTAAKLHGERHRRLTSQFAVQNLLINIRISGTHWTFILKQCQLLSSSTCIQWHRQSPCDYKQQKYDYVGSPVGLEKKRRIHLTVCII
jgi:hypothetical protein